MTLLIISHTEHYYNNEGTLVGLGSTVREIDSLAGSFNEIIHIACLYKNVIAPKSAIEYKSKNVQFVPIPPYGGAGIKKLTVFSKAMKILNTVNKELKKADIFQFRAPTSMGLYVIPFLTLFSNKKGWYKYAGNWQQEQPPFSYFLQKWWLLNLQKRLITINGKWPGQPVKCISFENPCLNDNDRKDGELVCTKKTFLPPFIFCFVGRLENKKGIDKVLAALKDFSDPEQIESLEIIGDGDKMHELKNIARVVPFKINLHGALSREKVFEILKTAHFILLPSESEGFPKVIAEAANFGCIPIVSNVSCIGQYITSENGFLWEMNDSSFEAFFQKINLSDSQALKNKSMHLRKMASAFTYEKYINKINKKIISYIQ